MRDALVRLEGVSRHYGTLKALDAVDLRIRAGEWLSVMGPSGSGKSTLINLLVPDAGAQVGDISHALNSGRHLKYKDETPLCNLYVWMLQRLGVRVDKFGDSTGKLEGLS